jgi:hypothetical protein
VTVPINPTNDHEPCSYRLVLAALAAAGDFGAGLLSAENRHNSWYSLPPGRM